MALALCFGLLCQSTVGSKCPTARSSCISGLQTCPRQACIRPAQHTRLRTVPWREEQALFSREKLCLTSSCLRASGNGPGMLKGQILPARRSHPCSSPRVQCAALQKPNCSNHWDGLCHTPLSFRNDARNTFSRAASPSQRMEVLSQQPQNLLTLPQGLQEGSQALDFHFV